MTSSPRRAGVAALAALVLGAGLAACGSDGGSGTGGSSGAASGGAASPSAAASPQISGTVTVFAAASLQEAFTELGKTFESAHPGTTVRFNFGGSSSLAQSIVSGAPADVFAAASSKTMKTVTDAGDAAGSPQVFVRNQLEIAVPKGNPAHIGSLADLAHSGVKVALCAKEVPCGAAAEQALAAGGVKVVPVTLEQDVKGALTKVELGEVDAALVYRTDVKSAQGKVQGIDFPESAKAINDYPIAPLAKAPNSAAAKAFVELVESAEGRRVLTEAGFQAP
ncbi:molybdate ABC transporter substrate-binding protein [Peterkaempfera bronchialis]|uniref:Molybdate ABC transporter substrate-binding protein n=2 Tax=Peterkaempfera bronchialis TaxID=2126346 RepID=A0A345T6U0_9ACTN|nr:molybdate ABC transporter substrate-binding protein [Peterkaempfera bronchialis]